MTAFEARYGGRCAADCGDPIRPGDDVQYVADELVHAECAPQITDREPARLRPEPAACPSCHLVHAGDCW